MIQRVEISDYNRREKHERKDDILRYLRGCADYAAIAGLLRDVFTGEYAKAEYLAYKDDAFKWTTKLVYHFEKYDCVLPEDFIQHILMQLSKKN